eukprot:13637902-Ditylum_brightwellii.AAC.1
MQEMMSLFNTMLQAMRDQQQHPPPLAPNKTLESALENMSKITCLQAEATHSATEGMWYNNVLSKLSTVSWSDLYDQHTNGIISATTNETQALSNHFYSSIRNALYGDALDLMDNKMSECRGLGVEFFKAMIPIYHPQWPTVEQMKKQGEFFDMFCQLEEGVDAYAWKFLQCKRELEWNGILFTPSQLRENFILSLGAEFTTIHNDMHNLPSG